MSNRRKRKAETQGGRDEDDSTKASDDNDKHEEPSLQALVDGLWSNDYGTVFGANTKLLRLLCHHSKKESIGEKVFDAGAPAYIFMNIKKNIGNVHRTAFIQQCFMLLESLLFLGSAMGSAKVRTSC
eukprot:scaffold456_cov171-Amphora_coffeaeformis.AAC.15